MNNAPASNISIRFGFKGPVMNVDAACASSSHAIGYAYNLIRFGLAHMVLTGGADSPFTPSVITAWSNLRALSERNDMPQEACRPFSRDRDGIVLGEGAGILILESEDSAIHRNAKIYAEVIGYGAASDGYHLTQPSPEGVSKAMRLALADASLEPEDINYINAHATGTVWNDKTETESIKNVFGSHAYKLPIVGIKAAIGHSIGASGALGLISCILAIRDGVIPPTINVKFTDPDCDLDYVVEGKRYCTINNAMSNSFAFGGSNAVLITSRYKP
jgi:3-oxoacyl-[acyl-carrier-protein] synthase II